jgi:hypothetical protein
LVFDFSGSNSDHTELSINQIVKTFINIYHGWFLDVNVYRFLDIFVSTDHALVIYSSIFTFFEISPDVSKINVGLDVSIGVHEQEGSDFGVQDFILENSAVLFIILLYKIQSL